MDPVAVIVEGDFVDKRRANGMCRVNDVAVGWIVEGIPNRRHIIAAPLRRVVTLGDLLSDEVTEHGEFVGEVVIDADHFFP